MKQLGILAYASPTGLGYQTLDYVRKLNPAKVLVIDLSEYNKMPVYPEWYEGYNVQWVKGIPRSGDIDQFLEGLDSIFMAETPLNYYLIAEANRRGIRSVNAYNYEFLDYFRNPEFPKPSVMAGPTTWNIEMVKEVTRAECEVMHLPVPIKVNPREEPIKKVETIGHILGRPAVHDRNGTMAFLDMVELLGTEFNYIIYYQEPRDERGKEYFEPVRKRMMDMKARFNNLSLVVDTPNNGDMYRDMDLLVLPRRYGGLCLPMQEALGNGIPVIMPNVSPNWDLLPPQWLVSSYADGVFRGHAEIQMYSADASSIVNAVRFMQGDIFRQSLLATEYAKSREWKNLSLLYTSCLFG